MRPPPLDDAIRRWSGRVTDDGARGRLDHYALPSHCIPIPSHSGDVARSEGERGKAAMATHDTHFLPTA